MKEQNINLTIKPFGPRNGEYYSLPKCTFNNPNPCIAPNNLVTYQTGKEHLLIVILMVVDQKIFVILFLV
jgi:hypothetical protein